MSSSNAIAYEISNVPVVFDIFSVSTHGSLYCRLVCFRRILSYTVLIKYNDMGPAMDTFILTIYYIDCVAVVVAQHDRRLESVLLHRTNSCYQCSSYRYLLKEKKVIELIISS